MNKRFSCVFFCLIVLFLLAFSTYAADSPEFTVDGGGFVSAAAAEGSELFLASYDPATGRFLGLLDPQEGRTGDGDVLLKAIRTDPEFNPVSESRSVLVISEEGADYEGGVYDAVVVTSALGDGTVRLQDLTVKEELKLYGGDVTLEAVTLGEDEGSLMAEGGKLSLRIVNTSGVGSVRIGKAEDGSIRLRTEEGCRVEAVYVEDGNGAIILDGAFNQIVVDTDAPVVLADVQAVGLTMKAGGADVRLRDGTSVSSVRVTENAAGAKLLLDELSRVASLESHAEDAVISGDGKVDIALVSGSNTQVNTVGTSLTVGRDAEGVRQNGQAVEAGETVVTGGSGEHGDDPGEETKEARYTVRVSREGVEDPCFDTLEEAMTEAEKNILVVTGTTEHGEEEIARHYAPIEFTGTGSLDELILPEGYVFCVLGKLSVCGPLELGTDSEASRRDNMTRTELRLESGAKLELLGGAYLDGQSLLENRGVLALSGWIDVDGGAVVNSGELRLRIWDGEDFVRNSGVQLNPGSRMENSGLIYVESREEDNEFSFIRMIGSELLNTAGGRIKNEGFLEVLSGGKLDNAGILENYCKLFMDSGENRAVIRDGGAPEQEESVAVCSFVNSGTLNSCGDLELRGGSVTLGGSVVNEGRLWIGAHEERKRTVTLQKTPADPDGEDVPIWGMPWEEDDAEYFWKVVGDEETITGTVPVSVNICGTLLNLGDVRMESAALAIEGDAVVNNEGGFTLGRREYRDALFSEPMTSVMGSVVNGAVTAVGEGFNASDGYFEQSGGSLENRGGITNNGGMTLRDVDYQQTSSGRLVTYNHSGLEISGGSITVPSGGSFLNEGHLFIIDRYGEEFRPCDLSGFEDFFTVWQENGNDSHWCEYRAEVYDWQGLRAAEAEQERRIAAWETALDEWQEGDPEPIDTRYNEMRIQGNLTLEEDTVLGSFGSYWLDPHMEVVWEKWDEENETTVPAQSGEEGAYEYEQRAGSTLTVPQGMTLTIAGGNALRIEGMDGGLSCDETDTLDVRGTLVIQGEQEGNEENGWTWFDSGLVEIWTNGSFICTGTVENDGVFEVRYHEGGTVDEETWEVTYDGSVFRSQECPVTGVPENTVYAFEAHTYDGLKTAALSSQPVFHRVYIRESCAVSVTGELSLPMDMNSGPGSGLIVECGAVLTLEGHLWNDGDVTVEGVMRVNSLDNNQSITIGTVGSSEASRLDVIWQLNNRPGAWLKTYNSASTLTAEGVCIDASEGVECSFQVLTWDEYNEELETDWNIIQIDADNDGTPVKLCGAMPGCNELRIMQGYVDISALDTSAVDVVSVSDMWSRTKVALGSNRVELWHDSDPEEQRVGCGFEIVEARDADIRVLGNIIAFAGTSGKDYTSTWLSVNGYRIDPHIFGTREYNDAPCVYIGIDDGSVNYELSLGGQRLQHEVEYHEDKTHLSRKDGESWFAAGPNDDPGLAMTVFLPEGVNVFVEHVPVKPEWEEPWD